MDISTIFLLLSVCGPTWAFTLDLDYGGVPLWINRFLGEPSVLTLKDRMDPGWFRAVNTQSCPLECDCPIQWPTALYCDHRGLTQLPSGLPSHTQYMFLQGNNITILGSRSLANATNLRWLILDRNQLLSEQLDNVLFSNLTRLVNLFINNNNLTRVPVGLPSGIKQLRLAYNRIEQISEGAFQNLDNLTLLLLQGNRLTTIEEGDLKGLGVLNLLDLSHNLLETFPKHLPPSVQQLYLSNNSLTGLTENSLHGFNSLRYLRLGHNKLRNEGLDRGAFHLTSLVELDLSYNQLTEIPTIPTTLQYLYLEVNHIQEFNVSSFCRTVGPTSYSRMKTLRLDGNKLEYHKLPPDWVFCLRVLHNIYI
ncbi:lumican-like [Sinocyclocheilus anshuiensis]|uniref:Lumican-like n=1 Tax=Sinocyclocheilus anshuiensis TaxID=1608454 RepID=A0A671LT43_9TELE|nr:PREDICTED: lumican-like [Sinocyclocheilus anshuiensis]